MRRLVLLLLPLSLLADPVRMRELMVGDDGSLNSTNAVATQADLARVAASNQVAVAELNAARQGYDQAVDLLSAVATNIAAGTPVVFYSVELSSFDAAVVFDENTDKVKVIGFTDTKETDTVRGTACRKWRIRFAFTADLQSVQPSVAYAQVIDGTPAGDWENLHEDNVSAAVAEEGTYTDGDGNTYSHVYHVDAWLPVANSGFSFVRIPNDAAIADGATLDLPNGVSGGATTTVTWGGKTLTFRGGLLTEVGE
jgi:hypothetical protein